ncbi:hypothetical protein [Limosilactobacillus reuteri]|uniref:hypothetical protein n=1 Tax=Limosilactobacillus reuteri TaxID=1598 RepID=UPI001C5A7DF7|nr:hypothetical protein [Limosilactobacillus reuteri]MBW3350625.1 hypothetical protein [Limosilactobacillus reuteri]UUW69668.1 hypothetical protein NUJ10_11560 [Limosilactobacillus reuteri]
MFKKRYKTLDDYIYYHFPLLIKRNTLFKRLKIDKVSEEEISLLIEELKSKINKPFINPITSILSIIVAVISLVLSALTLYYNLNDRIEKKLIRDLGQGLLSEAFSTASLGAMTEIEQEILLAFKLLIGFTCILLIIMLLLSWYRFRQNKILSYLYAYKRFLIKKKK